MDRHPRSPTFGGIAPSAEVLLDETGSAAEIFARPAPAPAETEKSGATTLRTIA
jgi:hypothetical protein